MIKNIIDFFQHITVQINLFKSKKSGSSEPDFRIILLSQAYYFTELTLTMPLHYR